MKSMTVLIVSILAIASGVVLVYRTKNMTVRCWRAQVECYVYNARQTVISFSGSRFIERVRGYLNADPSAANGQVVPIK